MKVPLAVVTAEAQVLNSFRVLCSFQALLSYFKHLFLLQEPPQRRRLSPSRNSEGLLEIPLGNSVNFSFDKDNSLETTSSDESFAPLVPPNPPTTNMDFGPTVIKKNSKIAYCMHHLETLFKVYLLWHGLPISQQFLPSILHIPTTYCCLL